MRASGFLNRIYVLAQSPIFIMFVAVLCFASSDAETRVLQAYFYASLYYVISTVLSLVLAGAFFLIFRIELRVPCRDVCIRGLLWTLMSISFIATLLTSDSQTLAYSLTLLHPFWTIFWTGPVLKKRVEWKRYRLPMIFLISGIVLYSWSALSESISYSVDTGDLYQIYVLLFPIAAGFFFALSNLFSRRLKESPTALASMQSPNTGWEKDLRAAIEINFQTLLVAVVLAPLVPLILYYGPPLIGGKGVPFDLRVCLATPAIYRIYIYLGIGAAIGALSSVCVVLAFSSARAEDNAAVATVDFSILPIAAAIDYFSGKGAEFSKLGSIYPIGVLLQWQGFGFLLIVCAAIWMVRKYESVS